MSALGVALLGEVKKRPEAVGHIAKHTEALRREVLEVRPQEITVLVQQISRRQEGSVAAERGAVEEAGRDLRAETKDDHIDLLLMTSVPTGTAMDPGASQ